MGIIYSVSKPHNIKVIVRRHRIVQVIAKESNHWCSVVSVAYLKLVI